MPADDFNEAGGSLFPTPVYRAGWLYAGRFELRQCVGRGGMGVVWKAEDRLLETVVAIKFLPEWLLWDQSGMANMKAEARRLQALTHPGIVRLHDLHQSEGVAALVFEFVEGGNLQQWRAQQPQLEELLPRIATWLPELCAALAYAHEQGIVHRDLKPANILLTADGRPKLTDFGLAEPLSLSVTRTSRRTGGGGTIAYMSPQQLMGEPPEAADDIYSLGATLFDLLTGKPPFYSGSVEMQILHSPPPAMRERLAPETPVPPEWEAWEGVVAHCLAKAAKERPANVRQVALDLAAECEKSRQVVTIQPSRPPRRRLAMLAAGAFFLGLFFWWNLPPREIPAPVENAERTALPLSVSLPPELRMMIGYQKEGLAIQAPLDEEMLLAGAEPPPFILQRTAAATDRFGRTAGAMRFSGSSQMLIDLAGRFLLGSEGAFSLSFWILPELEQTSILNLRLVNQPAQEFQIYLNRGQIGVESYYYSEAKLVESEEVLPRQSWAHLGVIWNAGRLRLFCQGRMILESALPCWQEFPPASPWELILGARSPSSSEQSAQFVLDDVRLYGKDINNDSMRSFFLEEPPPVESAEDWRAKVALFAVTQGIYGQNSDFRDALESEFGPRSRIADWAEIRQIAYRQGRPFMEALGLPNNHHYWVTRGKKEWFTNKRRYHICRFDDPVSSNYLAHDTLDDHSLVLGSWFSEYPILVRLPERRSQGDYWQDFPVVPNDRSLRPGWKWQTGDAPSLSFLGNGWKIPGTVREVVLQTRMEEPFVEQVLVCQWRSDLLASPIGSRLAVEMILTEGRKAVATVELSRGEPPQLRIGLAGTGVPEKVLWYPAAFGTYDWQLVLRPSVLSLHGKNLQNERVEWNLELAEPSLTPDQVRAIAWKVQPGTMGTRLEKIRVTGR